MQLQSWTCTIISGFKEQECFGLFRKFQVMLFISQFIWMISLVTGIGHCNEFGSLIFQWDRQENLCGLTDDLIMYSRWASSIRVMSMSTRQWFCWRENHWACSDSNIEYMCSADFENKLAWGSYYESIINVSLSKVSESNIHLRASLALRM